MAEALSHAVSENDVALVKQLIEGGVDVSCIVGGRHTPLFSAAWKGFVECAKLLLEANADVHKGDHWRWTPLHVASFSGHAQCVKVQWWWWDLRVFWGLKKLWLFAAPHCVEGQRECQNTLRRFSSAHG